MKFSSCMNLEWNFQKQTHTKRPLIKVLEIQPFYCGISYIFWNICSHDCVIPASCLYQQDLPLHVGIFGMPIAHIHMRVQTPVLSQSDNPLILTYY